MLKFYYNTGPNPMKVALCLEEMGLAYEPIPVDTRKGDQHSSSYLEINPNAKAPSIVDEGSVILGSLKFKRLHILNIKNNIPIKEKIILENKIGRIRDIEEMNDGSLIIINDEKNGGVYRLYKEKTWLS